jgi:hypothetical protein
MPDQPSGGRLHTGKHATSAAKSLIDPFRGIGDLLKVATARVTARAAYNG